MQSNTYENNCKICDNCIIPNNQSECTLKTFAEFTGEYGKEIGLDK